MKRFEAVTADKGDFGGWVEVRDTLRGAVVLVSQDFERAKAAADLCNAARPVWYASTYEGNVYFDVRCGPYAAARVMRVRAVEDMGARWAVGMTVARLDLELYQSLARMAAQ
ncbi:hypothetical protein [uncultured Sphingomonas sp.]|uniref:hypothetical protein n=1 Tax=uncultured Sphingomonas sp. TaxID=158754 RepID=UPI0025950FA1|nr:hypothetical protein [uncultured Sphingomonas sp.]